ncbi:unnamed protein product [Absidia cylindrospora]
MRPSLECRAIIGRGNDICVAQYLPRGVKNEYFGLVSVLGYNLARCHIENEHAMELLLITSLMTILDKAGDNGWKKETSGGALFLEPNEIPSVHHPEEEDSFGNDGGGDSDDDDDDSDSGFHGKGRHHRLDRMTSPKEQQQKEKSERNIEQRLQWMLEKDVRRSQKQLRKQTGSQQQSPLGSPRGGGSSPIPSPSTSTHDLRLSQHQQQLEHLSHMLSTMKHSGDATATLPSSFVQQTAYSNTTGLGYGSRRQLESMWNNNNNNNDGEDDGIPSRHYNSLHRSEPQRRLSSTDPHRVPLHPHRAPPLMTPFTSNPRYSVPVSPRQYQVQPQR